MTPCPTNDELKRWASGLLPAREGEALAAHFRSCPVCQKQLDTLTPESLASPSAPPAFLDRLAHAPQAGALCDVCHEAPSTASVRPLPTQLSFPPELPAYEIVRELGRGGMGVVYLARHRQLKRLTALKFLPEHLAGQAFHLARFRQEAEAIARLKHPGIVQIYDVGEHAGRTFLALEYVEGGSLDAHFHRRPVPVEEAARLIESIACAVQAAHDVGIVHRDLKPSNILLDATGPKVADFGLSRVADAGGDRTPAGLMIGTPQYMSPEQARGDTQAISPATDVYGLGAVLYELLVGKPPLVAASTVETLKMICEREPIAPSLLQPGVPAELDAICLRCLRKNPAQRLPTAQLLADELAKLQAAWKATPSKVSNAAKGSGTARRWIAATLGLALVALAALPIACVAWPERPQSKISAPPEQKPADPLPPGSEWYGHFAFQPAPPEQVDGDIRLLVDSRDGSRFTGRYLTEDKRYEWNVAGDLVGTAISWEFTSAVRDNAAGDVVGNAFVQGTLREGHMNVEFLQRKNKERAAMQLKQVNEG